MEALFPFGSRGAHFYVLAVRTLLFSTAILFCLCVQWLPLSATPHDMLVRGRYRRGVGEMKGRCVQRLPLSATLHDMLVRILLSALPLLMIIPYLFPISRLYLAYISPISPPSRCASSSARCPY